MLQALHIILYMVIEILQVLAPYQIRKIRYEVLHKYAPGLAYNTLHGHGIGRTLGGLEGVYSWLGWGVGRVKTRNKHKILVGNHFGNYDLDDKMEMRE